MRYREHPPPQALRPFVRCLWELAHDYGGSGYSREHLWATPYAELLVLRAGSYRAGGRTLQGVAFMGPRTRPVTLTSDERVELVAARFHVGGARDLLACRPGDAVDLVADAPEVLAPTTPLGSATTLTALAGWLHLHLGHATPDPVVVTAARIVAERCGQVPVTSLAGELGTTTRTLQRRFDRSAGMSPGALARILRFNRARELLVRDSRVDLAALAAETGYADHAHLTRTFRERFDLSPREFRELLREITEAGVASVQA
ncbi:AraC-like DNA-binding protein [Pseudonocardia hierapolitana]|uniref:AraC-like DNA-binding protein n=1 Tax=Pseudonocardia hierapolitana TaxID=1128676 RepID=A0A561T3F6_9PSEU|nr:helix-turn-helix domain-containing protein [Pseudonocardia hierapolitana]TWF81638.1 AraC-like DNA-binding protein [Pseudonocardia hierapolitana]